MKSGHGSCSINCTVYGSTITTSLTFWWSSTPCARSKLNFTSSAVNGSPLWNFEPLAQLEFEGEMMRALCPGFREARRHGFAGHRFHKRVMQPIREPERQPKPLGNLPRIKPSRRDGHVNRKPHFAFGLVCAAAGPGAPSATAHAIIAP